jgi:pyrroline-5-carboxylate reductase
MDTLSMGMSDDLEAAIAEGATLVRIGTAIFGPRTDGDIAYLEISNVPICYACRSHEAHLDRIHRRRQHGAQPHRRADRRRLAAACLTVAEPEPGAARGLARDFGIARDRGQRRGGRGRGGRAGRQAAGMPGVAGNSPDARRDAAPLAISIAAGIRSADLGRWLGERVPVIRAMPNTPALLGCGATVLCAGPGVPAHREQAEAILRAVGSVSWVEDETLMDVVTALSGSGPGLLLPARRGDGRRRGGARPRPAQARLLAVETALGAARMAIESEEDIAGLRLRVTSPGGTTEAALAALEAGGFRDLVERRAGAGARRSRELAELFGKE